VQDGVQGGTATLHCLCFSHTVHFHLSRFMKKREHKLLGFWKSTAVMLFHLQNVLYVV